jgi:hypothetical protein
MSERMTEYVTAAAGRAAIFAARIFFTLALILAKKTQGLKHYADQLELPLYVIHYSLPR